MTLSRLMFDLGGITIKLLFYSKGYYRAAKCHLLMGSIGNATNYLQKVLEKDPKNKDAQSDVSAWNTITCICFRTPLMYWMLISA